MGTDDNSSAGRDRPRASAAARLVAICIVPLGLAIIAAIFFMIERSSG